MGVGLLDEMSLVEMKERLSIGRVQEEEAEMIKRREITENRQHQKDSLRKRIENIERIRMAASSSNGNARSKQKSKEEIEAMKTEIDRKVANSALLDIIDERRLCNLQARKQLLDEEERRIQQQSFGGQGASAAEQRHFEELLKGTERESSHRQVEAQLASQVYELTKRRDLEADKARSDRLEAERSRSSSVKDEEVEKKRMELRERQREDMISKKNAFISQREKHRLVKEKIVALNPFATKMIEASRTKRGKSQQEQSY
jgi:hypothetical protein